MTLCNKRIPLTEASLLYRVYKFKLQMKSNHILQLGSAVFIIFNTTCAYKSKKNIVSLQPSEAEYFYL